MLALRVTIFISLFILQISKYDYFQIDYESGLEWRRSFVTFQRKWKSISLFIFNRAMVIFNIKEYDNGLMNAL